MAHTETPTVLFFPGPPATPCPPQAPPSYEGSAAGRYKLGPTCRASVPAPARPSARSSLGGCPTARGAERDLRPARRTQHLQVRPHPDAHRAAPPVEPVITAVRLSAAHNADPSAHRPFAPALRTHTRSRTAPPERGTPPPRVPSVRGQPAYSWPSVCSSAPRFYVC